MNSPHSMITTRSPSESDSEMAPMDTMALLGEKKEQVVSWVRERAINPRSISEVYFSTMLTSLTLYSLCKQYLLYYMFY